MTPRFSITVRGEQVHPYFDTMGAARLVWVISVLATGLLLLFATCRWRWFARTEGGTDAAPYR